jgi:hypothetical protein
MVQVYASRIILSMHSRRINMDNNSIQNFVENVPKGLTNVCSFEAVFVSHKGYQITVTWCPSTMSFRVWSFGTTYYGTRDQLATLISYIDFSFKPRGRKAKLVEQKA